MAVSTYSDLSFLVTPEQLYTKAEQVSSEISSMKGRFDSMKSVIEKTSSYWIGDAGDHYREVYSEQEPSLEEMFARLSEHVTDLQTIAGQYVTTEKMVQNMTQALPADVIV